MIREGRKHAIWGNPVMNTKTPVPRHSEIDNQLAIEICKQLGSQPYKFPQYTVPTFKTLIWNN